MTMNPLPSLLRASAADAANTHMRAAGRAKWSEDDWNAMFETQERLITSCYGRPGDNDPNMKFARFQIADAAERRGEINLSSDWPKVLAAIDAQLMVPA